MSLKTWHFLTAYLCHQRGHWQVMCLLTQRQQGAESTCQDAQVSGWPTSDNYVTSSANNASDDDMRTPARHVRYVLKLATCLI